MLSRHSLETFYDTSKYFGDSASLAIAHLRGGLELEPSYMQSERLICR